MCANQGMEDSGWEHRHVAEPTELPADQAAGGNALPHLHTHVVPRYADDPAPGRPLPFDFLDDRRQQEDRLQADALALRALVGSPEP
jgi:diadenosine tetraphosphate (Ap4A) HIT family hydrolase